MRYLFAVLAALSFFFLTPPQGLMAQTKFNQTDLALVAYMAKDAMKTAGFTDEKRIPVGTVLAFSYSGYTKKISVTDWHQDRKMGCPINAFLNGFVPKQHAWVDSLSAKAKDTETKENDLYLQLFCHACATGSFAGDTLAEKKCHEMGCSFKKRTTVQSDFWKWMAFIFFVLFVLLLTGGISSAIKQREAGRKRQEYKDSEKNKDDTFITTELPRVLAKLQLTKKRVVLNAQHTFTEENVNLIPINERGMKMSLGQDTPWEGMIVVCTDCNQNEKRVFVYDRHYYGII